MRTNPNIAEHALFDKPAGMDWTANPDQDKPVQRQPRKPIQESKETGWPTMATGNHQG